jgi:hypothetical protein
MVHIVSNEKNKFKHTAQERSHYHEQNQDYKRTRSYSFLPSCTVKCRLVSIFLFNLDLSDHFFLKKKVQKSPVLITFITKYIANYNYLFISQRGLVYLILKREFENGGK